MNVVVSNPQELARWFEDLGFRAEVRGSIVAVYFEVFEVDTGAFDTLIFQSRYSRLYVGQNLISVISFSGRSEARLQCMIVDHTRYVGGML